MLAWIEPRKKTVFRLSDDCEFCSRTAPPSTRCFQVKVSSISSKRCACGRELVFSFMSIRENRRLWRRMGRLRFKLIWRLFEGSASGCEGSRSIRRRVVSEAPAFNRQGSVKEAPVVNPELRKLGRLGLFSRLLA